MRNPLFILATPGSSGSLVCSMIGQHPEMYDLPQVNLFAGETYQSLAFRYGRHSVFHHGLLRAVAELEFGVQTVNTIEKARAWLRGNLWISTTTVYRELVQRAAPRCLVDGSCVYTLDSTALSRIQSAFPLARYLHLLRHPRVTLDSIPKLVARGSFTLGKLWLIPHLEILEFLEQLPSEQHVRLRLESLLAAPDLYLTQIAEWLGINTDLKAIDAMKHPENSPFASYGPINAKYGNDTRFLEDPAFKAVKPNGASHHRLGKSSGWNTHLESADEIEHYTRFFGYQ